MDDVQEDLCEEANHKWRGVGLETAVKLATARNRIHEGIRVITVVARMEVKIIRDSDEIMCVLKLKVQILHGPSPQIKIMPSYASQALPGPGIL